MQIKYFKTEEKLIKSFLKILKKDIRKNPYSRIGIDSESLSFLFNHLINYQKIDWTFVKLFSPIEYLSNQKLSFAENLKENLASKLTNFNLENFEYLNQKINYLKEKNAINGLYKFKDGLDILIFYLDYRGNFLLNDYESKISFLNFSTNGEKLVSPGIKSILLAKKIIFICKDDNDQAKNIIKNFVSKKIYENEMYTFLNFHENFCFLTLKKLVNVSDISLSMSNQDYDLWHDTLYANDLDPNKDADLFDNENIIENINPKINIDKEINIENNLINNNESELKTYIEQVENISDSSLNNELNDALEELDFKNDKNNMFIEEDNKNNEDINEKYFKLENIFKIDDSPKENIEELANNNQTSDDNENSLNDEIIEDQNKPLTNEKDFNLINDDSLIKEDFITESEINNFDSDNIEIENDILKDEDNFDLSINDNLDLNNDMFDYFEKNLPKIVDGDLEKINKLDENNDIPNSNSHFDSTLEKDNLLLDKKPNEKNNFQIDQENDLNKKTNWVKEKTQDDYNFDKKNYWYNEKDIEIKKDFFKPLDNRKDVLSKINHDIKDIETLKRVIAIKEETLQGINNLLKEINSNSIDIKNGFKIFKYCPDIRPCPLLMVFDSPNKKEYENQTLNMKTIFSTKVNTKPFDANLKHLWNHAAYISYNENSLEINLIAFTDFSYFIFLLRYLNKEVWARLNSSLLSIFENNEKDYNKEYLLIPFKK